MDNPNPKTLPPHPPGSSLQSRRKHNTTIYVKSSYKNGYLMGYSDALKDFYVNLMARHIDMLKHNG